MNKVSHQRSVDELGRWSEWYLTFLIGEESSEFYRMSLHIAENTLSFREPIDVHTPGTPPEVCHA
jgi:hypothetical protein